MPKLIRNTTVFALFLFALAACGDKAEEVKVEPTKIKAVKAVKVDLNILPGPNDLEFIKTIREGNERRAKSMLNDKKAIPDSYDENGITGIIAATISGNADILQLVLDYVDSKDKKALDIGDKEGKTALHYAALSNNPELVKILREAGANPNILDDKGNFPLYFAVSSGNAQVARAFLDNYPDTIPTNPDLQNDAGLTAVHAATSSKSIEMINLLEEYKANFNISDVQGLTPILYAVMTDHTKLFDLLISKGADINEISASEKTPLILAIEQKKFDFAKHILSRGANPNIHSKNMASPLQALVMQENAPADLTKMLIEKGAKLNSPEIPLQSVISRSLHKGNAPAVAELIAGGAKVSDLEKPFESGVLLAFKTEDVDLIKLMINSGSDINKLDDNSYSPLALAAKNKYKEVFELLLQKGADPNQSSSNPVAIPLDIVIGLDDPELLDLMFKHGLKAKPDAVLISAVSDGKFTVIPTLLKNGAKPNIKNSLEQPVLWLVVGKDSIDAAKILIEAGAELEVKDKEKGLTPLSIAVIKRNTEMARFLLEKGASPNTGDINGVTPLGYSALTGQIDLLQAMIAKGGDINAKDNSGRSIVELSSLSKMDKNIKDQIKAILTNAGAN